MRARRIAMLCLLAVGVVAPVAAQNQKVDGTPPGEAEMMAAMMKAGEPGENHKHLGRMAGDW